jgi:hypothetical protein
VERQLLALQIVIFVKYKHLVYLILSKSI